MSDHETKTARPNESPAFNLNLGRTLDGVFAKAMASEPATEIADLTSEWAAEATKFIKKNPWAAVLGAAAIGYYLGSIRNRNGGAK